jgi:hypothetical protein
MLTYSLGRGLEPYDKPTVRAITQKLARSGAGLQTLVREIVRSLPFRSRRAEGGSTAAVSGSGDAAASGSAQASADAAN